MRGGGALLATLLLAAPFAGALPIVGGPEAFTYEEVDRIGFEFGPGNLRVCYDGGSGSVGMIIGVLGGPTLGPRLLVRDSLGLSSAYDVPRGGYAACLFDSAGVFHAMYVESERYLHAVRFDGVEWQDQVIASPWFAHTVRAAEVGGERYFSVLVNLVNQSGLYTKPHVYTLDANNEWVVYDDSFPTRMGGAYSFDVDTVGRIHVLWDHSISSPEWWVANRYRQYSVGYGGSWTTVNAPYGNTDDKGWDMTLGPDDKPYFAYGDFQARPHVYAPVGPGGVYVDERPMEGGIWNEAAGRSPSIVIGTDGSVHLHHRWWTGTFDSPTSTYYYYSTRGADGWTTTPLLPAVIHFAGDITLDECNLPVIGVSHSRTVAMLGNGPVGDTIRFIGSTLVARPLEARTCNL